MASAGSASWGSSPGEAWGSSTKQVILGRYIGGSAGSGVAHLQVDFPGEVIDGRVRAKSQVVRTGNTVTVWVAGDRKEFAIYHGLGCACTRYLQRPPGG
jgi:hypothetical protein